MCGCKECQIQASNFSRLSRSTTKQVMTAINYLPEINKRVCVCIWTHGAVSHLWKLFREGRLAVSFETAPSAQECRRWSFSCTEEVPNEEDSRCCWTTAGDIQHVCCSANYRSLDWRIAHILFVAEQEKINVKVKLSVYMPWRCLGWRYNSTHS